MAIKQEIKQDSETKKPIIYKRKVLSSLRKVASLTSFKPSKSVSRSRSMRPLRAVGLKKK